MNRGELYATFAKIWVKHPLADKVFDVCTFLRDGKRNSAKGTEQVAASLLAESQSGKSRTVRTYISKAVIPYCIERGFISRDLLIDATTPVEVVSKLQRVVLHVTLSGGASVSSLLHDMLVALGDPFPSKGTIPERRHRVYTYLEYYETELIIIDEVQHLSTPAPIGPRSRREEATNVQNNLKCFLLAGYPILFVGRPEARHKIFSDEQVDLRIEEEINFGPLSLNRPDEQKIYTDFVGRLGLHLKKHGIFREVNLLEGLIVPKLCAASLGRLGVTTTIVRHACLYAIAANAPTIAVEHLWEAAETLVRKKFIRVNPFNDLESPPPGTHTFQSAA